MWLPLHSITASTQPRKAAQLLITMSLGILAHSSSIRLNVRVGALVGGLLQNAPHGVV